MERTALDIVDHSLRLFWARVRRVRVTGLTIRSKILLAFLALAMITGCLGAYATYSIRVTGVLVAETFDRSLLSISFARAALADFASLEAALARHRLTSDPSRLADLELRIDALTASVREDVQIAADRSLSPYAASTARDVETAIAAWEAAHERIFHLAANQTDQDWQELDQHVASVNEQLDLLINHAASGGFLHRQRGLAMIQRSTQVNIAATVLALMLGATVAYQLSRRIMGPVQAASDAARRIAAGALDIGIPSPGSDELGALLQAMEVMRDNIRVMVAREVSQRRSAQVLLTDAIESSCEGVLVVDVNGQVAIVNSRMAEFFPCLARLAANGASFNEVAIAVPALQVSSDAQSGYALTRETCLEDSRWVNVSRSPTQAGGFIAICSDMTALKRREAELRATNLCFDAALSNMSQGLCLFDASERLRVVNRQFCELFSLPAAAVLPGISFRELLRLRADAGYYTEPMIDEIHARQRALLAGGTSGTMLQTLADGRQVAVSFQLLDEGGWVTTYEDVSERRRAEAQIVFMARHDTLTQLPNRAMFRERLELATAQLGRGVPFAVLCLGLDHFKQVNDAFGHQVGDEVLAAVAERLSACVRETDTVARLGDDEFAVLQVGLKHPEEAGELAARIIQALRAPFPIAGQPIQVSTSVGAAVAPSDATEGDTLLRKAELALFRAKMDGRNAYRFFEAEMDARLQARRAIERDLRTAIAGHEFELFYQPLVEVSTEQVCGFEALLRWNHPVRGMVSPAEFIPIAEETGLIVEIGEWVIGRACLEASYWPANLKVAVNVSLVQFKTDSLVQVVIDALALSGLPAARLEIEVTETVLLSDDGVMLESLRRIRDLGVRISMDDFGTGYSSLSYLHSFPFDKIKIDQSFVRHLTGSKDSAAIIRAIAGLGTSLGMRTTAEGVETEAQLMQVKSEGCTEVQGYYFSKPVPAGQVAGLIRTIANRTLVRA